MNLPTITSDFNAVNYNCGALYLKKILKLANNTV